VLKITRTETPVEEKWILQGRLVGLWVSELRRCWKKDSSSRQDLKCIVDLNEVTFIDEKGERLLRTMSKEGAQLMATGMYIKHVLQQRCWKMKVSRSRTMSTKLTSNIEGEETVVAFVDGIPRGDTAPRCCREERK